MSLVLVYVSDCLVCFGLLVLFAGLYWLVLICGVC